MLVEGLRMLLPTGLLIAAAMVVAACGGADTTAAPSTTVQVSTSPTTAPVVGGVATRLDNGCSYEGRTEFDVDSEVIFTFVNGTEEWDKGFSVLKVPEGFTVEGIDETQRAFNLPDFEKEDRRYCPYLPTGRGRGPSSVSELSVVLDRPGLHALICFEGIGEVGQDYAASLFTVNE